MHGTDSGEQKRQGILQMDVFIDATRRCDILYREGVPVFRVKTSKLRCPWIGSKDVAKIY